MVSKTIERKESKWSSGNWKTKDEWDPRKIPYYMSWKTKDEWDPREFVF